MGNGKRWFFVGSRAAVRTAVANVLGGAPASGPALEAVAGDVVVIDAEAAGDPVPLPTGHAFGGVRALKERKGVAVFVVVAANDRVGVQLARFVLADGVLTWHAGTGHLEAGALQPAGRLPKRASVDELLARLQPAAGSQKQETSLQRLLRFEREDTLLHRLQDEETGLFDGPYATLKLDEEWKRAHRFHQPLLLLLDLGPGIASMPTGERRLVLAEAAGVFLNECRDIDVLARFQPTVFLFLLPGTGPDGAEVLAQRIMTALRGRFHGRHDLAPAAGLCSVPAADVPDRKAFLAIAEACLARATAAGPGTVSATWQ